MGLEKCLKRIKDSELDIELLKRKNEKLCAENDIEIGKLEVVIDATEKALEAELKKSGEDKLECKLGSVSFNKMPDEWKYQDEILMAWIISLPEKLKRLYLKITTVIKKSDLKKQIMADNDHLFFKSKFIEGPHDKRLILINEELPEFPIEVEGIEIEPQDPKFTYTIKKKK
jgi:hypothetical protein